jgi:hypothetical protein
MKILIHEDLMHVLGKEVHGKFMNFPLNPSANLKLR